MTMNSLPDTGKPILRVRNLTTCFETTKGTLKANNDISYTLHEGETLGIVGESGSGKSVSAHSILNIVEEPGLIKSGEVYYDGRNIVELSERELRNIRGNHISMVIQDTSSALNPLETVGYQIARVIRKHQSIPIAEAREQAVKIAEKLGIPEPQSRLEEYPHQFSGGLQQRVLIAMAVSCEPDILILDEPTSSLDVITSAQILEMVRALQLNSSMGIILITHDLSVVAETCDRVAVFYAGQIVERSSVTELFENPKHPYTRGLLRSLPRKQQGTDRLRTIGGDVPELDQLPSGCAFHPRCPHATEECKKRDPEIRQLTADSAAACLHTPGYREANENSEQD